MRDTWVWSLGLEDPLEEGMTTHSGILAWRIPMDRGAWQITVHRVIKSWAWLKTKHSTPYLNKTLKFLCGTVIKSWWHLPLQEREDGWKQLDIDVFQTQWCQLHETLFLPALLQLTQERTLTSVLHAYLWLISVQLCPTLCDPWTAAHEASLFITNSWNLLKLMSIESVMPSNHLILCRPLLLPPLIFPSIRVFSNESALHMRWLKFWSFSFNISLSNEYSGLISFRMDWLYFLAVQGHSQESSPTLQFKSIDSLALSFLYGPTLTSIHDYWKNHSLAYTDLCWQSIGSAF